MQRAAEREKSEREGGAPGSPGESPRKTFAIISHPDAGKTTLTEKFLLYSGAIQLAGAVKSRKQAAARSDWMEMERQRGISISSTVLGLTYGNYRLNLLDTPGHRDFSEDTYRTLYATDCALMVLDAAKGLEPQTLKLFEVCRMRGVPIITFVNKMDRPSREPLELIDQIEQTLGLETAPVIWPVGNGPDFEGVVERSTGRFVRHGRTAHGASAGSEASVPFEEAAELCSPGIYEAAREELGLLDAVGAGFDEAARESFLGGELTPVFFGSALSNFGVRQLLEAVVELAPGPVPREGADGELRGLDEPFSGLVFKVQANMDPRHRDQVAFVRVCSGRFQRGMPVTHAPSGRTVPTRHAQQMFAEERSTLEEAIPGDIVGLVNAGGLRVGDSVYSERPISFPGIPEFEPEHFLLARNRDTSKHKQFRRGLEQLSEEGAVKVLQRSHTGAQEPVLGAVGPLQFEVAAYRMEHEFGAPLSTRRAPFDVCRRVDEASAGALDGRRGVEIVRDGRGSPFALFESRYWLERAEQDLGYGVGVGPAVGSAAGSAAE